MLRPLAAFACDCGLSMIEVNTIFRKAAVQSAAARQLEVSNRVNNSGIAVMTGIPRGEVSRILSSIGRSDVVAVEGRQNIASRILSAWHCDPEFLTASRLPRDLKIFGHGATFERLVKVYGQGIPIRAILDELKRVGAIQLLTSSQTILPKMRFAINPRVTIKKIKTLEAIIEEVSLCLLIPSDGAFEAGTKVWSGRGPLVRRKLATKAVALVRELGTRLTLKDVKRQNDDTQKVAHLSVRIVYGKADDKSGKRPMQSRRNFHRNR